MLLQIAILLVSFVLDVVFRTVLREIAFTLSGFDP